MAASGSPLPTALPSICPSVLGDDVADLAPENEKCSDVLGNNNHAVDVK